MPPITRSALLFATLLSVGSVTPAMADFGRAGAPVATIVSNGRQPSGLVGTGQTAVSPAMLDAYRRAAAYRARPPHTNDACNRARFSPNPVDFQGYDAGDIPC